MKLLRGKYQTVTKVNELNPEINNVEEADGFDRPEGGMIHPNKARSESLFRGLRQWYDIEWRFQELGRPGILQNELVSANNQKMKECGKGMSGVGPAHSSEETGNDRGAKGLASVCRGEEKHRPIAELEEL